MTAYDNFVWYRVSLASLVSLAWHADRTRARSTLDWEPRSPFAASIAALVLPALPPLPYPFWPILSTGSPVLSYSFQSFSISFLSNLSLSSTCLPSLLLSTYTESLSPCHPLELCLCWMSRKSTEASHILGLVAILCTQKAGFTIRHMWRSNEALIDAFKERRKDAPLITFVAFQRANPKHS